MCSNYKNYMDIITWQAGYCFWLMKEFGKLCYKLFWLFNLVVTVILYLYETNTVLSGWPEDQVYLLVFKDAGTVVQQ